jgi:hypothetical protein
VINTSLGNGTFPAGGLATPSSLAQQGHFAAGSFSQDDYVIYTASWNGTNYTVRSVKLVESVTQVPTEVVAGQFFVANGTTYRYSAKNPNSQVVAGNVTGAQEMRVFFDEYGYVMFVIAPDQLPNFAVFLGTWNVPGLGGGTDWARLLYTDGTTADVRITSGSTSIPQFSIVSYATASGGALALTLPGGGVAGNAPAGIGTIIDRNMPRMQINGDTARNWTADHRTIFLVETSAGTYARYVGIGAVPSLTSASTTSLMMRVSTPTPTPNLAHVVFVRNANIVGAGVDTANISYVHARTAVGAVGETAFHYYSAVVGGEVVSIRTITGYTDFPAIYTGLRTNSAGLVTQGSGWFTVGNGGVTHASGGTNTATARAPAIIRAAGTGDTGTISFGGEAEMAYDANTLVFRTNDRTITKESTGWLRDADRTGASFYYAIDNVVQMIIIEIEPVTSPLPS